MSIPADGARSAPAAPGATRETAPAWLAFACAGCGLLLQVKVVIIGELYAGEIMLLATAVLAVLIRGVGRRIVPWFPWMFAAAAFLMLLGYVIADLLAATTPAQYLRGWARIVLFGLDFLALILLVSHGQRLLAWFAAGLALGIVVDMSIAGNELTVTAWKSGYGFAAGLLAVLLAGHLPTLLAGTILGAFGILSILLDFRSLGAIFLVAGAIIVAGSERASRRGRLLRMVLVIVATAAALVAVAMTLIQSDPDYHKRRQESNIGRYVGLRVAVEAIADSPFIGYGSWAADKLYVQLLRREYFKASAGKDIQGDPGDSLLPHSQLLQAWVEGGLLAATFFVVLGVALISALRWLVLFHRRGSLTPLFTLLVIKGMWDLCFSPFLGQHRIHLASVLATLSLLAWERASVRPVDRAAPGARLPA